MSVILIAFERESEQSAVEQLLTSRGHQVTRSGNGLTALDCARREPPHAIISDIVLPRMDGFALCRKWKQDERLQSVPFLFYTRRHDDPKYERFALELGAERFLARSAPPETLLAALDEVLGAPASMPAGLNGHAVSSAAHAHAQASAQGVASGTDHAIPASAAATALIDTTALQRVATLEAALEKARRTHAEALESLQHSHAETLQALRRSHAEALDSAQRSQSETQAQALQSRSEALERAQQAESALQAQIAALEAKQQAQARTGRAIQSQQAVVIDLLRCSTSEDEATILRRALEQTAAALGSPLSWLHVVDQARNVSLAGWFDAGQRRTTLVDVSSRQAAQGGFVLECIRARRAVSSSDPQSKTQQDGLPGLGRYLAVPAVVNDEVIAVLGVANRDADYAPADEQGLLLLADGLMRIVLAKRVHVRTLKSFQRADVALQGMIDSFVRVSEWHDPYTAGSSRRLAALAVAIGREAGLDGERQHALRVASLLHDVGNIAVPAVILAKPAPLSETELALMRTHVDEGCQLLADIDFGAPVADIVYQSHERYDGSGYPRGLQGDEILLEARILAIADTVEAMCSPRPYRPAAGMAAAIGEIRRGSGRLYDPDLVDACVRLVGEHGFRLPE